MSFMEKQITNKMRWFQVETSQGTEWIQGDVLQPSPDITIADLIDYCEGIPVSFELIEGYGARLSAPGYLDCTEWTVFQTVEEAREYLEENYPEDDTEES
jgi:hypothetical protein